MGPAEQRLRSYDRIQPLVWGHLACGSDDVHKLADVAGGAIARWTWQAAGAQTLPLSRAAQVRRVDRLWGLTAARARARASLAALAYVAAGQIRSGDIRTLQDASLQRHQRATSLAYSLAAGPAVVSPPLLPRG
eukprot:CAMPEP_0118915900 /NCGR_PEP_ID=MMETSP1166-20130328/16009_1 /TAXON_ID=1104430 /ORGANISM="Chrysoreinhardia sp, Strain CCMP3193" /LENGTH=133 /DNA_ID=CAMNT_0006855669 /DNA_START=251 /DNA_END=652 /DNA_ORIENTATION=-